MFLGTTAKRCYLLKIPILTTPWSALDLFAYLMFLLSRTQAPGQKLILFSAVFPAPRTGTGSLFISPVKWRHQFLCQGEGRGGPHDVPSLPELCSVSFISWSFLIFYLYAWCFAFVYIYVPYLGLVPLEDGKGCQIPGTGISDAFKLQCGCWKCSLGPPEEKPVILNTELSLQSTVPILKGVRIQHIVNLLSAFNFSKLLDP